MNTSFHTIEIALLLMVFLRIVSGLIELIVAGLMFKFNSLEKAISLNALLVMIGPTIFMISIAIGLTGMADRLSLAKFLFIGIGVLFILLGIRK